MNNNKAFTLFPLEEKKKTETCKTCMFRQRWQFGNSIFQYCGVRKSNRTSNGMLKIRCKDVACILYKSNG